MKNRLRYAAIVLPSILWAPGAGMLGAQDETEPKVVRIDTMNVRDTVYHLSDGGGNTLALVDEINGGVVLIDTKRPGWGQATLDAVGQVTDLPVTTIINTHAHPDHAGSNGEFGPSVEVIAHENTKANMTRLEPYVSDPTGLPTTTFVDRHSLLEDLDEIDLYFFGPAHTDGDVVVVFPAKGVAYLGDLFPSNALPVIDAANGGSGVAFAETLERTVAGITGVDRVVTGHGPAPSTYAGRGRRDDRSGRGRPNWDDLAEYAAFVRAFTDAVEEAYREGKTVEQAVDSLQLPERFADYALDRARTNIEVIYDELAVR